MLREHRLFESHVTNSGPSRLIHISVRCSKCPEILVVKGPRRLPDQIVAKKAKRDGWLVVRSGHHVCPACLRGTVPAANRLAETFKVTHDGAPVPPASEIVAAEAAARDAKLAAALDRHFPQTSAHPPAPAAPDAPDGLDAHADRESRYNRTITVLERIAEGQERLIAINERRNAELTVQTALFAEQNRLVDQQNRYMEQHLQNFESLLAHGESQLATLQQLIRAVAAIAPVIARSSDSLSTGLREVMSTMSEVAASLDEPTPVIQPPGVVVVLPNRAGGQERLESRAPQKSAVSVRSRRHGSGVATVVTVERSAWDEAGFTAGDRVAFEHDGSALTVRRDPDGVRPKRIGPKTVQLQTTRLGSLNFTRYRIVVAPGCLRI